MTAEGLTAGDIDDPPSEATEGILRRSSLSVPIQFSATLAPLDGVAELTSDTVGRDGGSRDAIALLASDFAEYYCKGPSLTAGHPYIGANEHLAGRLARLAGLPCRNVELISWGGQLFAGSQLLAHDRKMTGPLTPDTWSRLVNAPDVAYDVAAFDVWILNEDRHDRNWLGGVVAPNHGMFLAMDHDLSLLGQGRSAADLVGRAGEPASNGFVRAGVIRDSIVDEGRLRAAVTDIQRVDDRSIQVAIGQLPDEWVGREERLALYEVLRIRRDRLWDLLQGAPASVFPKLVRV